MNNPLDELRSRLHNRSSDEILDTTFRRVSDTPPPKAEVTKAKEPKMSNRTTKNNTGLEDYTDEQVTAVLDAANTMAETYPCVLELKKRIRKYRETLGNCVLADVKRLKAEYQKYNQDGFSQYYEPEPEPEPASPPPPPPKSLTYDIIQDIQDDLCEYGPYLMEIWESDWDYKDRRTNNKRMDADQWKAKDWTITHKDDRGTILSCLSESQWKFMMVLLKAYLYHKQHPEAQANDPAPPF